MNPKKEFRAPDGYKIVDVRLTPEQQSWLAKARDALRNRVFPKQNSAK
ncbi:MAG: hypothetical protein V2A63_00925 [Patescibacteria group bacterium]